MQSEMADKYFGHRILALGGVPVPLKVFIDLDMKKRSCRSHCLKTLENGRYQILLF